MENQISKQAILDYLNERIDVRSKHEYDVNTSYHYSNEAALHAFKSIVTLIEQGVFDEQKVEYKELTEDEYSTFDTLRKELYNNKSEYIWPHNISKMRKFISDMETKYFGRMSSKVNRYFSEVESLMYSYEEILEQKYNKQPNGCMIDKELVAA